MESQEKLTGENGCLFVDNSVTGQDIYLIQVLEDTVFTVLKESTTKGGSVTDVLSSKNLSGKTVKSPAQLTPTDNMFSDISISSGSLMVFKIGK